MCVVDLPGMKAGPLFILLPFLPLLRRSIISCRYQGIAVILRADTYWKRCKETTRLNQHRQPMCTVSAGVVLKIPLVLSRPHILSTMYLVTLIFQSDSQTALCGTCCLK